MAALSPAEMLQVGVTKVKITVEVVAVVKVAAVAAVEEDGVIIRMVQAGMGEVEGVAEEAEDTG